MYNLVLKSLVKSEVRENMGDMANSFYDELTTIKTIAEQANSSVCEVEQS